MKQYLCCIISANNESPGPAAFIEEFERRIHKKYGPKHRVMSNWESSVYDKFQYFINICCQSKYLVAVYDDESRNNRWFSYLQKTGHGLQIEKKTRIAFVGINDFTAFPWNILCSFQPITFRSGKWNEDKWSKLLEELSPYGTDMADNYQYWCTSWNSTGIDAYSLFCCFLPYDLCYPFGTTLL